MTRIFPSESTGSIVVTGAGHSSHPTTNLPNKNYRIPQNGEASTTNMSVAGSTSSFQIIKHSNTPVNESIQVMPGEPLNSDHMMKSEIKQSTNKLHEELESGSWWGCIPLRLFISAMIALLIVVSCVSIWVTTFVVSKQAIENLANDVIGVSNQKILSYLDAVINPLGKMSKAMAADYNWGIANENNFRKYLFPKYYFLGATSCGYFFGYPSTKYTYSITGVGSKAYLVYSYQTPGFIGTIRDTVNNKTGAVIKYNSTIDYTPFFSAQQDYYNSTIELCNRLGIEGVYGPPYKALNSSMAIYHSSVVYDPVLYASGIKKAVGVTRINMSLGAIVSYLSKIVLIGRGYCLVSQTNGMMIGGSINTLAGDGETNLHLFNITDRHAGKLMRSLFMLYGNDQNMIPPVSYIRDSGVSYIVSSSKYTMDNMKWNVYLIVYEEDIFHSLIVASGISIGVFAAVTIVGVILSVVLGSIIARPLKKLEEQFSLIKVLDLNEISLWQSPFKEINNIFQSLGDTVVWLKEIKTFIPDYVFEQIQTSKSLSVKSIEVTKVNSVASNMNKASISSLSQSHLGGSRLFKSLSNSGGKLGKTIFQMGLHTNLCCVIHVIFKGFTNVESSSEKAELFTSAISNITPLIKLYKANIQILTDFEFQIVITGSRSDIKVPVKGLECALKVVKTLESINQTQFIPRVGVSVSEADIGNIGTKNSRFFAIVGKCVKEASKMAKVAVLFNLSVVADSSCFSSPLSREKFIARPIDRYRKDKLSDIESIWTVLDEKNHEKDEWLYELENSKRNNTFDKFLNAFCIFTKEFWEKTEPDYYPEALDHNLDILKEYAHLVEDHSLPRLISVLTAVATTCSPQNIPFVLTNYSSELGCEYRGLLLDTQPVANLHIEM
ncbi:hypothetical protein C9374_008239 [Naegleria lovaniensis]|uniref:Guanylate cyclase domain-containing protein n=1 Tax=Naegleria lovaniensis TaxID=51637 RepID=A0AA88GK66_NAELO|nr:uncharacterized protein C9374_008239 [Naegleria lovaniensis]KAG2378600.1 hypothetical protein C9374_008239 [Naegleria lovaniensis]